MELEIIETSDIYAGNPLGCCDYSFYVVLDCIFEDDDEDEE
jgi:hypothetical protein